MNRKRKFCYHFHGEQLKIAIDIAAVCLNVYLRQSYFEFGGTVAMNLADVDSTDSTRLTIDSTESISTLTDL